jgi:acetate kinase
VGVDRDANEAAHADADISADGARVRTVVVTAREDVEITRQVDDLVALVPHHRQKQAGNR